MDGRFQKVDVSKHSFNKGSGLYCNNEHRKALLEVMKDKFGKPNGNSLRDDECTWKYVLEYQGVCLTVYDYGELWSLGFLERSQVIPDYELIYAVSRMLFNYLSQLLKIKLQANEAAA